VDEFVRWCGDSELFWDFWRSVLSAIGVQHVSDLHPKFSQRPHYVRKYGTHQICHG